MNPNQANHLGNRATMGNISILTCKITLGMLKLKRFYEKKVIYNNDICTFYWEGSKEFQGIPHVKMMKISKNNALRL